MHCVFVQYHESDAYQIWRHGNHTFNDETLQDCTVAAIFLPLRHRYLANHPNVTKLSKILARPEVDSLHRADLIRCQVLSDADISPDESVRARNPSLFRNILIELQVGGVRNCTGYVLKVREKSQPITLSQHSLNVCASCHH